MGERGRSRAVRRFRASSRPKSRSCARYSAAVISPSGFIARSSAWGRAPRRWRRPSNPNTGHATALKRGRFQARSGVGGGAF
jgi:hypothetical protein